MEDNKDEESEGIPSMQLSAEYSDEEESFDEDSDSLGMNTQLTLAKTSEARLFVDRIVLEDFKSYRGERIIGPFHKEFNAVVGPNGSGKSNILDAFLFVFGSKPSNLRVKSFKELINNSNPKPRKASVDIHCYEIDRASNQRIRGSEFKVSRIISQSGGTMFRIDGQRKTAEEMTQFWKSKKIDLASNRIFILQNQVENISTMSPKKADNGKDGLIEFLEEIIGSDQFVPKIFAARQEIGDIENAQAVQLERVKVMENLMKQRAAKKDAVVEHVKRVHENKCLKIKLLIKEVFRSQEIYQASKEIWDEAKKELAEVNKSNQEVVKKAKALQKVRNGARSKATHLDSKRKDATRKYRQSTNKLESYQEKLKHTESEIKKVEKKNEKILQKAKKLALEKEENKTNLDQLEEEMDQDEEKLKETSEQYETKKAELMEMTKGLREELEVLQEDLQGSHSYMLETKSQYDDILHVKNEQKNKLKRIQKKLEKEEEKLEKAKAEKQKLKKIGISAAQGLIETQEQLKVRKEEIEEFKKGEREAGKEYEALKEKYFEMEKKYSSQTPNSGGIAAKLLKAQEEGRLTGIQGRIGDLGTIPAKFDVAASTVGRGALNNILVNTAREGEACINFLKKYSLGRARFTILEKIQRANQYLRGSGNVPHGCHRIIDEVQCAEKHRVAFANVFRNWIIARNLDHASQVAYVNGKPVRATVTVDGEQIRTSGAMSGGGRRKERGAMNVREGRAFEQRDFDGPRISPAEIKELRAKRDDALKRQTRYQRQRRDTERDIMNIKREKERLERETSNVDQKYTRLQKQISHLKGAIENVKEQLKNAESADGEDQLDNEIEDKKKVFEEAEQEYAEKNNIVEEKKQEIAQAGGKEYKKLKKLVNKLQGKIEDSKETIVTLTNRINQATKKIKSFHLDSKKYAKVNEKHEKQREKQQTKINVETEINEKLEEEARKTTEEYNEAKKDEDEAQKQLGALGTELRECKDRQNKAKRAISQAEAVMRERQAENDQKNTKRQQYVRSIRNDEALLKLAQEDDFEPFVEPEISAESCREIEDSIREIHKRIQEITTKLNESNQQEINKADISQWKQQQEKYLRETSELEKKNKEMTNVQDRLRDLNKERLETFLEGFEHIQRYLKQTFRMLTASGDASLELEDSHDPFNEGVIFSCRPPDKQWCSITALSGGEKTLASLALIFAIHQYDPAPIYVMDEIDAALDYRNTKIIAKYLEGCTKSAQFMIVSLRPQLFDSADNLFGVYKIKDVTQVQGMV